MALKPRPSSLPSLDQCPRWVPRPKAETEADKDALDAAADEGTAVHEKMEALAGTPVQEWDSSINNDPCLGPALAPVVREAADQVRDIFSMGLPVVTKAVLGMDAGDHYELGTIAENVREGERYTVFPFNAKYPAFDAVYCECGLDSGIAAPGTGDVVVVQGIRGFYIDYKSNRVARDHRAQVLAYVLGMFRAVARLDTVEARIVAPRLFGVHDPEVFTRAQVPEIEAELNRIIAAAEDPFTPGCPGQVCAMCAGNGRCPYQAASLKDIPVAVEALVRPQAWLPMLSATTPELRGERKRLCKWLEAMTESWKEEDKAWALENPDLELPGFAKTVAAGRPSLDKTRLAELNQGLCARFGLGMDVLCAFMVPDKTLMAEYVAINRGINKTDAEAEIKQALAPYLKRGADIVQFRAVKPKKEIK